MRISILQWNIWYKEDIENIVSFLQKNKADVICLQELSIDNSEQPVKNTVTYVAEQLGYEYAYKEVVLEDQKLNLANAIFSKYPIEKSKTSWINTPSGTNNYDDQYRAYVEASIGIESTKLDIGTVHMSYTDAFQVSSRKLNETNNLMEEIKDKARNYILTGDFNAQPNSDVIKLISDRLVNVGPELSQNTWTTKPFSYNGFEAKTLDWRLDYIFTTSDITLASATILDTNLSDHLPILAYLDVE